jgi:hypothetical protein
LAKTNLLRRFLTKRFRRECWNLFVCRKMAN